VFDRLAKFSFPSRSDKQKHYSMGDQKVDHKVVLLGAHGERYKFLACFYSRNLAPEKK
jgi:hypothetical protein